MSVDGGSEPSTPVPKAGRGKGKAAEDNEVSAPTFYYLYLFAYLFTYLLTYQLTYLLLTT